MAEQEKKVPEVENQDQLSDDQLKDVAGGLSDRFQQERIDNLNSLNERFEDAREQNLDS